MLLGLPPARHFQTEGIHSRNLPWSLLCLEDFDTSCPVSIFLKELKGNHQGQFFEYRMYYSNTSTLGIKAAPKEALEGPQTGYRQNAY